MSSAQTAGVGGCEPKMRLKRCGSIEIERGPGQDRCFQDERVEEEVNPWALKCHRDNLKKVTSSYIRQKVIRSYKLVLSFLQSCWDLYYITIF